MPGRCSVLRKPGRSAGPAISPVPAGAVVRQLVVAVADLSPLFVILYFPTGRLPSPSLALAAHPGAGSSCVLHGRHCVAARIERTRRTASLDCAQPHRGRIGVVAFSMPVVDRPVADGGRGGGGLLVRALPAGRPRRAQHKSSGCSTPAEFSWSSMRGPDLCSTRAAVAMISSRWRCSCVILAFLPVAIAVAICATGCTTSTSSFARRWSTRCSLRCWRWSTSAA